MKRVLVTGSTGFIGRSALRILASQDVEVHALTTQEAVSTYENVSFHRVDLLDIKQINPLLENLRATHLLHLAWEVDYDSPLNYEWVHSSIELIKRFNEHGGKRAVLAGTCYEYDALSGYCTEELTPLKPLTKYGVCKDVLRRWAMSYSKTEGLSTIWPRIFFVYGPNEKPTRLVPSVIRALLNNEEAPCSHGEQIRDYIHVHDVASACIALLQIEAQGVVNIGSGEPVRLKNIVKMIGEELGKSSLIRLGAIMSRNDEPDMIVANPSKMHDEIGWEPAFSLESGLKQTIQWWRDQHVNRGSEVRVQNG